MPTLTRSLATDLEMSVPYASLSSTIAAFSAWNALARLERTSPWQLLRELTWKYQPPPIVARLSALVNGDTAGIFACLKSGKADAVGPEKPGPMTTLTLASISCCA